MIQVEVSRNENRVLTAKWNDQSQRQAAKSVRYSVEKLGGTSSIETKCSIVIIYGGKMNSLYIFIVYIKFRFL